MTENSEKSPLVRGSSAVDMLREQGIDIDSLSEGSTAKEIIIDTARQIRAMRKQAGLSQSELARIAHMAQADISRIESGLGKKGPSIETIYRLALACQHECTLELTPANELEVVPVVEATLLEAILPPGYGEDQRRWPWHFRAPHRSSTTVVSATETRVVELSDGQRISVSFASSIEGGHRRTAVVSAHAIGSSDDASRESS